MTKFIKKLIKIRCMFIFDKKERKCKRMKLNNSFLNYLEYRQYKKNENSIKAKLNQIQKKMGLENNIFQMNNVKIYVPRYPLDLIQQYIVDRSEFFEYRSLKFLDIFINEKSNILDIGANIGNHSLYWGKVRNVNSIHCFEPIKSTFDILKKNIEINNLSDKVTLHNVAVGDNTTKGSISWYKAHNIGATGIKESKDGEFDIIRIDDIKFKNKIDFIKIDVEGFELKALAGMKELIKRDKPVMIVESYGEAIPKVIKFLENLGYECLGNLIYPLDFIFVPEGKTNYTIK